MQGVAGVTQIEYGDTEEGNDGLLALLAGIEEGETIQQHHGITLTSFLINT